MTSWVQTELLLGFQPRLPQLEELASLRHLKEKAKVVGPDLDSNMGVLAFHQGGKHPAWLSHISSTDLPINEALITLDLRLWRCSRLGGFEAYRCPSVSDLAVPNLQRY